MKCKNCGEQYFMGVTNNNSWIPIELTSLDQKDYEFLVSKEHAYGEPFRFIFGKHIPHFCRNNKNETINK